MLNKEEIDKLDLTGWPLPNEYLVEIGRVAALWAALEGLLTMCLGKLAGFDTIGEPKTFIIMKHSSFPQKLDMFGSLCEQLVLENKSLTGYKNTIALLKRAQKARNKFMHNGIVIDEKTNKVSLPQLSARGKLKTKVEEIELADVIRASTEIDEAQMSLVKLVLGVEYKPTWKRIDMKNKNRSKNE